MEAALDTVTTPIRTQERMKIAFLGTRGIPNQYGGFEQFAEKCASRLVKLGHEIYVYCSHNHPYKENTFKGVKLVRCYDPEYKMGTAGQFVYDFNCILDSRRRSFDVVLQLGYTSSTIWSWLMPRESLIVTNMDGLEWKRAKYNIPTRWFLKQAEKWGARYSDRLIADSKGIKDYLQEQYQVPSTYIPYGAEFYEPIGPDSHILEQFMLVPYQYDILVARFEPENNIEAVLKAYAATPSKQLVLVGNHHATDFGMRCYRYYGRHGNVRFIDAIYDEAALGELRYFSRLYIHGHSVGGTNPSLLEAMACNALIAAHDNIFNRGVLNEQAFFFRDEHELAAIIKSFEHKHNYDGWLKENKDKIRNEYNWNNVTEQLDRLFRQWV